MFCLIRVGLVGLVGLVASSFSWQEILQVLHEHGESVVAVFAGHDHDGGVSVEPFLSITPVMSRSYVLLMCQCIPSVWNFDRLRRG